MTDRERGEAPESFIRVRERGEAPEATLEAENECITCHDKSYNKSCINGHADLCLKCWQKWSIHSYSNNNKLICPTCRVDCAKIFDPLPYKCLEDFMYDENKTPSVIETVNNLFEEAKNHPLFDSTMVYMNPVLAAKVIPEEFDLARTYLLFKGKRAYEYMDAALNCPFNTLEIWASNGVTKLKNLHLWIREKYHADHESAFYDVEDVIECLFHRVDEPAELYFVVSNLITYKYGKNTNWWVYKILQAAVEKNCRCQLINYMHDPGLIFDLIPINPPFTVSEIVFENYKRGHIKRIISLINAGIDLNEYMPLIRDALDAFKNGQYDTDSDSD